MQISVVFYGVLKLKDEVRSFGLCKFQKLFLSSFHSKFLIILALTSVLIVTCQAKLTKECLVDYLKKHQVSDSTFDSIDAYNGDQATCTREVKTKIDEIHSTTRVQLDTNPNLKPYADCVMRGTNNEQFENFLLQAEAVEMKGVGLKFWKIGSKNDKVTGLTTKAQDILDKAIESCRQKMGNGVFFDTYFEQKRLQSSTDEFDYCLRKRLVEKQILSTNQYGLKVNPKNIPTNNIDCDAVMKDSLEELRNSINFKGPTCIIDTFVNNGYLENLLKIRLLSKLDLTPAQKEAEKQLFLDSMVRLTEQVKSCTP